MNKERELLKKVLAFLETDVENDFGFGSDIKYLLAQPEEGVYQKLLRIEDGIEVEILPSELWQDGYEAGKRSASLSKQPEQTQEPVAWMFGNKLYKKLYGKNHLSLEERNSFIPLYTAPPKREPISFEDLNTMWCGNPIDFARRIESIHGIGDE